MPFKKGHKKEGGRKKGSLNRTNKEARELFIKIMNKEIDYIPEALEMVRTENQTKYLDILSKLFQYTMPKQIDIKSDGDKISGVTVTIVDATKDTGK